MDDNAGFWGALSFACWAGLTMALARALHSLDLLALCAAYLEGGLTKLLDLNGAVAEMQHFDLQPARALAAAACSSPCSCCWRACAAH